MQASLLLLGMLHRGDLHPYEMKRRAERAMVGCYLDVDVGTLYYAARRLEKQGAITVVGQERVARGGMRTIYSITEAGRALFRNEFFRQFDADGPVSQTLYGALLFADCVEKTELIAAVRRRIDRTADLIAKLAPLREQMEPSLTIGGRHLFDHVERQRRLDRDWLTALLRDLEVDNPPRLG